MSFRWSVLLRRAAVSFGAAWILVGGTSVSAAVSPKQALTGLRGFYAKTARADGSFANGIDPQYRGMSDSAYSDLAAVTYAVTLHKTFGWKLPHEEATKRFLLSRQQTNGDFFNEAGTVDPKSAEGRVYNTTQGIVALHALGFRPRYDPLGVFAEILKEDYKTLPAYSTSFFPLAYLAYGEPIPAEADRRIRATMQQAADGYLNDHIAATFHAAHYHRLVGEPTPMAEKILERVLRDQKPDGSWLLNMPSRDRHATFDAVFTLRQLGEDRAECRAAIQKAARWALSCRNSDGGFGHFPGSPSDADANYFQVGLLVMAGFLKPVEPLPPDPHLLSWGHLMGVHRRGAENAERRELQNAPNLRREQEGEPTKRAEQFSVTLPSWAGALSFSANGKRLTTACADSTARVFDVETSKELMALRGHEDCVVSVAFAPDERTLATGSYDQAARLWDVKSGRTRHILRGHRGAVMCVAFSPDGNFLASGSLDATAKLWDSATGKFRATLNGHKSWVNALVFSPDGQWLVSGSSDGTLKLWRMQSRKLEATIDATDAEVRSVAISPDGRTLAAGIRYGVFKVFDFESRAEKFSTKAHESDVWSVAFSANGRTLISADGDWRKPGQIKFWDAATFALRHTMAVSSEVLSIAYSANGRTVAAASTDGSVKAWSETRD